MEKTKIRKFIDKLSPVKKKIAEALFSGLDRKEVDKKFRNAFVTMVIKAATKKGIEFKGSASVKVETKKVVKELEFKSYTKGKEKVKVRERTVIEMMESKIKDGLVLTLSSYEFLMEKMIFKKLPNLRYIVCEKDKEIFDKADQTITKENLTFVESKTLGEIGVLIRLLGANSLAHAILDYCGTLTRFAEDIKLTLQKNLVVVGGTIMVTLSQRDKGGDITGRLRSIVKQSGGGRYEIEYEKGYRDTGAMFTIIIRRIK